MDERWAGESVLFALDGDVTDSVLVPDAPWDAPTPSRVTRPAPSAVPTPPSPRRRPPVAPPAPVEPTWPPPTDEPTSDHSDLEPAAHIVPPAPERPSTRLHPGTVRRGVIGALIAGVIAMAWPGVVALVVLIVLSLVGRKPHQRMRKTDPNDVALMVFVAAGSVLGVLARAAL